MNTHQATRRGKLPAVCSAPKLELVYTAPEQREFPHVVKFSGGRSSAVMLLGLLYSRQLKPSRGDVVVFNNTSTESPATYKFVKLIQRITEERFNIPFFWTEFTTYEDASRGEWRRLASYRLVKPRPYVEWNMRKGYHRNGEVFEELVSWKQQLPNRFARICTEFLKLHTTARFLADWFGRSGCPEDGLRRLGHWYNDSRIDPERYGDRREIAAYHIKQPLAREAQTFQEYTSATLTKRVNPVLRGRVFDRRGTLKGDDAVPFVSVVGLRADEPQRVGRVLERNGALSTAERFADGESVTAPLFDAGLTKNDIREFWAKQDFDLELPHHVNQSNCVFCFMKGERELRQLVQHAKPKRKKETVAPDDVEWWRNLENRYARKVRSTSDSSEWSTFGFFGKNRLFYDDLASGKTTKNGTTQHEIIPCECTD